MLSATLPFELHLFGLLESQPALDAFIHESTTKSQYCQCKISKGKVLIWQCSINEDDTPELTDTSSILEKMQLVALSRELPSRTVGHRWNLVYSTAVHGISLKTLYRNTQNIETPVLLVIIDQEGQVFGAFLSDSPKVCEGYYGTGESMLFKFLDQKTVKAYRWTGTNSFFIKGDSLCLSVGGGDGTFGLWLDGDLNHGRSHSCKTFDNDTLSSKEDFICRGLEAWSFE